MTKVIAARQKAVQALLLTSAERGETRFTDDFWDQLVGLAWDGKSLSDRRAHRAAIQKLLNEAIVQQQGLAQ